MDGINNTGSIDRVSIAREKDEKGSPSGPKTQDEYVVDKTVSNSAANGKIFYRVRCYSFFPTDDTEKPVKDLPHYFISRDRKRRNRPRSFANKARGLLTRKGKI